MDALAMNECPDHPHLQVSRDGDVAFGLACTHLGVRHVAIEVIPPSIDYPDLEFYVEAGWPETTNDTGLARLSFASSVDAWAEYQRRLEWLQDG
jgi:hypothetical protein